MTKVQTTLGSIVLFALMLNACGPTPTGTVPDSLATIEAQAEDIIDITPGGAWENINADIDAISEAWKNYQPQAKKDDATQAMLDSFDSAFSNLQMAASDQDKAGTMQASNDISAVVVDLFDLYHPAIPADVGRLDVLERQVVFDTAVGNFNAVNDDLANIDKIWETLKPSVLAHDGQEAADQFEAILSTQAEAVDEKDSDTLTREARNALELVDVMEQLY